MAIINEIKCARCDRKYSGVRSRCPYCKARRIGRGKYSEDSDNAKGKMLISVLIMGVFTVAAGILLFTTPVDADSRGEPDNTPAISNPEEDINNLPSLAPTPTPSPTPSPEPIAPVDVSSIEITYEGNPLRYETNGVKEFSLQKGRSLPLGTRVEPAGVVADVEWEGSTDYEDVFEFSHVTNGEIIVLGVETGSASLIARAGDKEHRITVRITN
ncbi:MAG: hypothetical protein FWD38_10780 [Oscillospiraceae bacterium]|nr:hypothetical protein [Oscillospiraceae bacterium]